MTTEPSELVQRLRRTRVAIETYWMPLWKERLRNSVKGTIPMTTPKQETDRAAMVDLLVIYGWDRAKAEERALVDQAFGGPRITLRLLELQHLLIAALEHGRSERDITDADEKNDMT